MKILGVVLGCVLTLGCSKSGSGVASSTSGTPMPAPSVSLGPEPTPTPSSQPSPTPTFRPTPTPTPDLTPEPGGDSSLAALAGTYDVTRHGQPVQGASLSLGADGRWTIVVPYEMGSRVASGRAYVSGNRITLVPETVDGQAPQGSDAESSVLIVSPDGRMLRQEETGLSFAKRA